MFNVKQIKPFFDRVLLRAEPERQTAGGIFVPRDASERSQIMTVVCSGEDKPAVAAGDRVVVAKYAGTEVVLDTERFLIVKQCEILAVIE